MSTVAEQYPARTDANGTTWYRPARSPGSGMEQWGWTSNAAMADPSYAQDVTVCSVEGATARDRAAVLEFAAQLRAKAASAGVGCAGDAPNPRVPAVSPGWLPALPVPHPTVRQERC